MAEESVTLSKGRGWTFAQVPIALVMDERLSAQSVRFWVYLAWRQGIHEESWPSVKQIADDLSTSMDSVRRWSHELETAGYLEVEERPGHSNLWRINAISVPHTTAGDSE